MKKNLLIAIYYLFSFFLFSLDVSSKEITDNNIKSKVQLLEQEKDLRQKEIDLIKQEYQLNSEKQNADLNNYKLEIDKKTIGFEVILWVFGIGLIGTIIAGFFYFKKFIKDKSEEIAINRITERIANIVDNNKNKILDLIKSQDLDYKIKNSKKLLIISQNMNDSNEIKDLFLKFGFLRVDCEILSSFQNRNNYDLIIFDFIKTPPLEPLIKDFLDNTDAKTDFIYYGGSNLSLLNNYRNKANGANSKFTLYSQVMNTLKVKELLNEN